MPNHIKNRLILSGSLNDLDAMIKKFGTYYPAEIKESYKKEVICKLKGDEWKFCWLNLKTGQSIGRDNKPMQYGLPDGYEIEIRDSFLRFPDFAKVIEPPNNDAYNDLPSQEAVRDSPDWWYTWNIKNWGTKWNSYSCERPAINVFEFETAWSPVPQIIGKISAAFPEVTIEYAWADEDTGYNCGTAIYYNGLLSIESPDGGSREAYEIAFDLRPDRRDNYELVNGKYRYKEEVEEQ